MRGLKRRAEAHVRLYRHELDCPAYRSLSPDARALLIEFRALFVGRENRIFMSIREIERRLGVGQKRAQRARSELLDRGFIRLLTPGGFSRKDRRASEYALTNEPLEEQDGATPPKDFMKWSAQESTVVKMNTDGSQPEYREHSKHPRKPAHNSQIEYRKPTNEASHGSHSEYTDKLPGTGYASGGEMMLRMALFGVDESARLKLCLAAMLVETRA